MVDFAHNRISDFFEQCRRYGVRINALALVKTKLVSDLGENVVNRPILRVYVGHTVPVAATSIMRGRLAFFVLCSWGTDSPFVFVKHHDHTEHYRMMIRDFRRRFYVSIVLTLPVLALSPLIEQFLGFTFGFPGDGIVVFALATMVFLYGGRPFLSGLVGELKQKTPGMMTRIGLAITVANVCSAAVTVGLEGSPFYWELATLIAIMLAGHWIAMASVLSASSALEKLARLMPNEAHRKSGDNVEDVPLSQVQKGVTRVFILIDGSLAGSIALSDAIRPESYKAIEALHKRGIKCWMLTGDNEETARAGGE